MIPTPDSVEGTIILVVRWMKLGVEIFGAGLVTLEKTVETGKAASVPQST